MFDYLLDWEHAIWFFAALLYVVDNSALVKDDEVMISEGWHGSLVPIVGNSAIRFFDKIFILGPIFQPHRATFVCQWGKRWLDDQELDIDLQQLRIFQKALWAVRPSAVLGFTILFVAGPLLTHFHGIGGAVLFIAPCMYATSIAATINIFVHRKCLAISRNRALMIGFEICACPAYLPNLVHKISRDRFSKLDGIQIILKCAPEKKTTQLALVLERMIEGRRVEIAPERIDEIQFDSYLSKLRKFQ